MAAWDAILSDLSALLTSQISHIVDLRKRDTQSCSGGTARNNAPGQPFCMHVEGWPRFNLEHRNIASDRVGAGGRSRGRVREVSHHPWRLRWLPYKRPSARLF